MSIHLTRELENLQQHIMSMCAMVEGVVQRAIDELAQPNPKVSGEIVEADDEVDQWDVRIEEECLKILALHQPLADDLRRVATIMKIGFELERMADVAVNIAERAACLAGTQDVEIPPKLHDMATLAIGMLRAALHAFVTKDTCLARDVCAQDDAVDDLNREIIEELSQQMKRSPGQIAPAMHLFSISRHIERLADHATNIAEDVVYLVEGEIIRHREEFWRR